MTFFNRHLLRYTVHGTTGRNKHYLPYTALAALLQQLNCIYQIRSNIVDGVVVRCLRKRCVSKMENRIYAAYDLAQRAMIAQIASDILYCGSRLNVFAGIAVKH